jgi:Rhs element Vgr protein
MSSTATPLSSENVDIVNIKVFVDDSQVDNTYQITEVAIYKKLNKIAKAAIYFLDGDVAEGVFPIMESNEFSLGTSIKIELGYGTGEDSEVAFQGVIAQVDVHTSSAGQPLFIVRCVDLAFKMTLNNQYYLYDNKKDSDLIKDIVDRHEVKTGKIESSTYTHPTVVQFGLNDWDFLLSRAKKIGYIVYVEKGEIFVKEPESSKKSFKVTFGKDIIKQQLSLTANMIFSSVVAESWNATDQKLRSEEANKVNLPKQGDKSTETKKIAAEFADAPQKVLTHADLDTSVISDFASGQLLVSELNKINGYIIVPGSNGPKLDSAVEVLKMGNYFTGDGYISGIEHYVKDGKWTTKLIIGIKNNPGSANAAADHHTGIDPTLSHLQTGIVKQVHNDPAGNARILVEMPGLEGNSEGVWARVLQRYATNGAGEMVFPEVGDEVILGFLNANPQFPIVFGSLFSQKNATPFEVAENNNIKSFISREKLSFSYDEEKKEISLTTPAGNQLILSDDKKGIRLEDQNKNVIELNDKGITIEGKSDLKVKMGGDVIIEATGKIELSAKKDVSIEGMNVKTKANMKIEGKANIIESKATAQAVIKGGIIQIN